MLQWRKLHSRRVIVWTVIWIVFGGVNLSKATTYYVAPDGKDNSDGRSMDHPWQTLARASGASLQGGDELLLRRGGAWREFFTVPADGDPDRPVIVGAYGQGNRPCIDGGSPIDPSKFAAADSPGVFRAGRSQIDNRLERSGPAAHRGQITRGNLPERGKLLVRWGLAFRPPGLRRPFAIGSCFLRNSRKTGVH